MLDKQTRDEVRWRKAFDKHGPRSDRTLKEWFELPGAPAPDNSENEISIDKVLALKAQDYFLNVQDDAIEADHECVKALDERDEAWHRNTGVDACNILKKYLAVGCPGDYFYQAMWAVSALYGKLGYGRESGKLIDIERLSEHDHDRVQGFINRVAHRLHARAERHCWNQRREQTALQIKETGLHFKRISNEKYQRDCALVLDLIKETRESKSLFKQASSEKKDAAVKHTKPRFSAALDHFGEAGTKEICWPKSNLLTDILIDQFKEKGVNPALSAWLAFEFGPVIRALELLPPRWVSKKKIKKELIEAWNSGSGDGLREKYATLLSAIKKLKFGDRWPQNFGKDFHARKQDRSLATSLSDKCKKIVKAKADSAVDVDAQALLASTAQTLRLFHVRATGSELAKMPPHEVILRCCDVDFWKKKIRKTRLQQRENVGRAMGAFGFGEQKWVSDAGTTEVQEADRKMKDTLAEMYVTCGEQTYSVLEIIENSSSNEKNRAVETFKRIEGLGKYAQLQERVCVFVVLTLESEWHRTSKGKINKNWNGKTTAEGHKELNRRYKIASARFSDAGIEALGFRTTEAHADGTPHWNIVAYLLPEQVQQYKDILVSEFYQKHDPAGEDEREEYRNKMRDIRVRFKTIEIAEDADLGQATVRYIAKYIFKHLQDDQENEGARGRHQVWNSIHSIRKFQFFGTKPIGIYRELRRHGISAEAAERLLKNGVFDSWPAKFQDMYLAAAGMEIEKDARGNRTIKKLEHVDFCDYLLKTEPFQISLADAMSEPGAFTQEEIERKAMLAQKLNIDPEQLGLGKYGNKKAKKKDHFIVVFDRLEHVVPCAKRADWEQCDYNGNKFEEGTVTDLNLDIDYITIQKPHMQMPEFSLDALARIVSASPTLLFINENAGVELFKNNPSPGVKRLTPENLAFERLKAKIFDDLPPNLEDLELAEHEKERLDSEAATEACEKVE